MSVLYIRKQKPRELPPCGITLTTQPVNKDNELSRAVTFVTTMDDERFVQ